MADRETAIATARSFIADCHNNGLDFYKAYLFGSAARNQMHPWSDIDLLLISDKFTNNIFENLKLYSKINIRYPSIETHPYPTDHFLSGDSFIEEIRKEAIEL